MKAKKTFLAEHDEMEKLERQGFKCRNARDVLINISNLLSKEMCCNDCKLEIIMKWLVAYYQSL